MTDLIPLRSHRTRMDFSGIGPHTPAADQWRNVAKQIADIIRVSGIEIFRQSVRQVTFDRLKIEDEQERRKEARCEALKKDGVLYRDGSIPDRPKGDWYFHQEILRGKIKLPAKAKLPPKQPPRPKPPACLRSRKPRKDWNKVDQKAIDRFRAEEAKYSQTIQAFWHKWNEALFPLFEHVKQRGFPDDGDGDNRYDFDLCCWLPGELRPAKDPRNYELLPVPNGALTDIEKIAVLAAIYDAHWPAAEKVAPWGVSEDGGAPDAWPADEERNEKRAAMDYFLLFQRAQRLDDADLPVVASWLEQLPPTLRPGGDEPGYLDITLGDREAKRFVAGKFLKTSFGRKEKPWQLFRELFYVGHDGLSKQAIAKRLWPPNGTISDNNLDQHKSRANALLESIRIEIRPDNRGVWRLAALDS